MEDFECHITLKGNPLHLKQKVESLPGKWTFSCIDGDPSLGDGVFCYATAHYGSEHVAAYEIYSAVRELNKQGESPLRAKIEHVVFDIHY